MQQFLINHGTMKQQNYQSYFYLQIDTITDIFTQVYMQQKANMSCHQQEN